MSFKSSRPRETLSPAPISLLISDFWGPPLGPSTPKRGVSGVEDPEFVTTGNLDYDLISRSISGALDLSLFKTFYWRGTLVLKFGVKLNCVDMLLSSSFRAKTDNEQ